MTEEVALDANPQITHEYAQAADASESARPSVATVEHLLYALVFLVGLGARLLLLGAAPFTTSEAAAAWAAWMDATALHPTAAPVVGSALLHALQTFAFWITGGGNETLARLPVALLSSLIPLLPWFWRDRLGRPAALVLAALLALDPWLLAFGRMADATALSAALALLALTAIHVATRRKPEEEHGERGGLSPYVAAASIGLLLVSGPQAWPWLAILALFVAMMADDRSRLLNVRVGLVGLAAALLGATGWFAWPKELAMVSESLSTWLRVFAPGAYDALWPALRVIVDQPFVAVFGVAGLILLWIRPASDRSGRLFLTLWLAIALLLLLLPGRSPDMLPLFGIPLAVSAALAVQGLFRLARSTTDWGEGALLAVVLFVGLLSMFFWVTRMLAQSAPSRSTALVIPMMLLILALLLAVFARVVSGRQALVVVAGVLAIFLLAASFSASRQLSFDNDPSHPNGFFATTTWADATNLRADVRALSDRRTGYPTELPVQIVTGPSREVDPLIGWLLRDMANVSIVSAPLIEAGGDPVRAPLVVMAPGVESSSWNENYIGSTIDLRSAWQPDELPPLTGYESNVQTWNAGWRPRLRWMMYRAAPVQPVPDSVNLWATPQ